MTTYAPLITIGIDVGGSCKGFHAVALTDGAYTAQLHSRDEQEIVHWCRERIGASVIAIDAAREYDGKDYFTILDFVKAHHHFSDPEWDGEQIAADDTGIGDDGSDPARSSTCS